MGDHRLEGDLMNTCHTLRVLTLAALVIAIPGVATVAGIDPTLVGEERFHLKVWADEDERDRLAAGGYDIAGYDLLNGWVEVVARSDEMARLENDGFSFEIMEIVPEPAPLRDPGIDAPLPDTNYTSPAEMEAYLAQVASDHPGITRLEALGTSHEGRTIWGIMISDNAGQDEDELSILFSGAHHAREVMSPEVVMDIIDHLTDGYGSDPDITARVDAYQIWCVPIVNPDGNARVHDVDYNWRKNTRDNDDNGVINYLDGVDLNRNYEWGWGGQCRGSSSLISDSTYRGPGEASEPEVRAMVDLGRRIRPVFDVEYHSYGEDVFYAMSCDPRFSPKLSTIADPDQSIGRVIAEAYAAAIVQADGGPGYFSAPYGSRVDGTGRDHQYHENGAIAFVTELNSAAEGGFRPAYDVWRQPTVEGQRPGWLYLIDRISGPAVGGTVLDAVRLEPVEADVSLDELTLPDGKRLTSRPDSGRFHIIVVPGTYTLRVGAPGFEDAVAVVEVTDQAGWVPHQVLLQPLDATPVIRDDLEDPASATNWTVGAAGDAATSGIWEWGEPEGTHQGDVPSGDLRFGNARFDRSPGSGRSAFVTGNPIGAGFDQDDVDDGATTLTSPSYDLAGYYGVRIRWQRWFSKDPLDPADSLVAEVSIDGGTTWDALEILEQPTVRSDGTVIWEATSVLLDETVEPGPDVRLRFRATDLFPDSVVEAAVDEIAIDGFVLATQGRVTGLRVEGGADTVVTWSPVPGGDGAVYDVVRGDLASLAGGAEGVDLGDLTCIENDSADTSTSGDEDPEIPASGAGFFYLARFRLGLSAGDLGVGSEDGVRAGNGGCP
jgi:hypothetical protein